MLTTDTGSPLTPEQVAELVVTPLAAASVAMQVCTVVATSSSKYRIPRVTDDPNAAWTPEGQEITPSDAAVDEIEVEPSKLAALSIISNELADDSSPDAADAIGDGMTRDCARRIDQAFFSTMPAPAPPGLTSIAATLQIGPAAWADLDPFTGAVFAAEAQGAAISAWVAHPNDAATLALLKESTGSNRPLMQPDAASPTRRVIGGIPLWTCPDVTAGHVWGIPRDRCWVVRRTDVTVESDRSVFFTSDRTAVKTTMRLAFGFTHEPAVVRVELGPAA